MIEKFALTAAQYWSLAVSIATLAALIASGKIPERVVAYTLSILMVSSPYLALTSPSIHAAASGIALVVLLVLALRYDRWWLIGAAGLQLVIFSTHFVTLVIPQERIWGAVSLRIFLWQALMALCIFAIGECRWASYAKNS